MAYVVDASVAAKWFLPEPYNDQADKLLRDFVNRDVELMAPDLIVGEIWKRILEADCLNSRHICRICSRGLQELLGAQASASRNVGHCGESIESGDSRAASDL